MSTVSFAFLGRRKCGFFTTPQDNTSPCLRSPSKLEHTPLGCLFTLIASLPPPRSPIEYNRSRPSTFGVTDNKSPESVLIPLVFFKVSRKVSSLVNRSTTTKSVCCFFGRLIALLSNCKLTSSLVPHVEAQEENASKDLSFTVNTGAVASATFKFARASCT